MPRQPKKTDGGSENGTPVTCEILRDTWDENGLRRRKGSRVGLPIRVAFDLVEAGAVRRGNDE